MTSAQPKTPRQKRAAKETVYCNAVQGRNQCRATKDLTRTLISLVRSPGWEKKLPEKAIVMLCPKHLRLTVLETLVAVSK